MKLSIESNDFGLNIEDDNLEFTTTVSIAQVSELILFLNSKISILRNFKNGIKMGRNHMLENIDDNGYYLWHNGASAANYDLDI